MDDSSGSSSDSAAEMLRFPSVPARRPSTSLRVDDGPDSVTFAAALLHDPSDGGGGGGWPCITAAAATSRRGVTASEREGAVAVVTCSSDVVSVLC
jgi:hypothetical protein